MLFRNAKLQTGGMKMRKKNFDMERCVGCNKEILFGQKTGINGSWHARCWKASEQGAASAKSYINDLLLSLGYPSVDELQAKVGFSSAVIIDEAVPISETEWTKMEALMMGDEQMQGYDGAKLVPAFGEVPVKRPHAVQIA